MHSVPEELGRRLRQFQQEHVLIWWNQLGHEEQRGLLDQLQRLDLAELQRLHARRAHQDAIPDFGRLTRLSAPTEADSQLAQFRERSERAFGSGQVAFLMVAGGQGTRLGFDAPKGMFPVGPVSGKTLFQLHSEKILALQRRFGKPLPLLIMTSSATHDETVAFFEEHRRFGLPAEQVHFFQQGTMPALDFETGKLLLEAPGRLCLSPNGHGGVLAALVEHGLIDRLERGGITTISYFQVDNPLTNLADFEFLGRHLAQRAEVSTKVLPKKHPKEKMGNLVLVDGRCSIIEYSDLPDEWATHTTERGELFFWGGNTAIHLFEVDFLGRVSAQHDGIPWHLAKKKVPYLDAKGKLIQPTGENALKFERFIFDVLPLAERWTVAATSRERDFEPIKNASGNDSPETARRGLIEQAAAWLEQAGVTVPRDAQGQVAVPLEISALFALDCAELQAKIKRGMRVEQGLYLQ